VPGSLSSGHFSQRVSRPETCRSPQGPQTGGIKINKLRLDESSGFIQALAGSRKSQPSGFVGGAGGDPCLYRNRLTEAQARLFAALWAHRHQAQSAEFLMRAAGLSSEKPMDVFKIKAANRGDPLYLGPLQAYEQLVSRQRRLGLYQLAWAQN
jgi:hypothetical protein